MIRPERRQRKAKLPQLLQDEQGHSSTARVAFWITLLVTLTLCVLDAIRSDVTVPVAAYSLLGTTLIALASWAAGPRFAQYFGPQLGGIAQGIADAAEGERPTYRNITEIE